MTLHRRLEERLATFTGQRAALLFGSGALANLGVIPALARRGEVVLHDELSHCLDRRRLPAVRRRRRGLPPRRRRAPRVGAAPVRRPRDADRHRRHVRHGRRRRAAGARSSTLARRYDVRVLVDEAHALGALGPGRPRRGRRGRPRGRGRRHHRHARQGARLLRRLRRPATTSPPASSSTPPARCCTRPRCRRSRPPPRWPRWTCWRSSPAASTKLRANAEALRDGLAREGFDVSGAAAHVVPLVVGDSELRLPDRRPRARAGRLRRGRPPARRPGGHRPRARCP